MMMMALSVKFSFTSLGSACDLKLELEINKSEECDSLKDRQRLHV